jgi:hypothetical protein
MKFDFNLSHAGDLAIVGSGRVGIDAETVQSEIEVEDLRSVSCTWRDRRDSGLKRFHAMRFQPVGAPDAALRRVALLGCWCVVMVTTHCLRLALIVGSRHKTSFAKSANRFRSFTPVRVVLHGLRRIRFVHRRLAGQTTCS